MTERKKWTNRDQERRGVKDAVLNSLAMVLLFSVTLGFGLSLLADVGAARSASAGTAAEHGMQGLPTRQG